MVGIKQLFAEASMSLSEFYSNTNSICAVGNTGPKIKSLYYVI